MSPVRSFVLLPAITSVFSQPARFRFGNVSRALPDTRGPGLQNFDISLLNNTAISEQVNLQLRFEAFNAFNRANLGNPQFGVISSTGPARVIQVASQVIF